MIQTGALVLYDADCLLCRNLAQLVSKRAGSDLRTQSWQSFRGSIVARRAFPSELLERPADQLRVWSGARLLEGRAAWEYLLASYRDLKALDWLASQLGLSEHVASVLQATGRAARRFCGGCSKHRHRR